MTDQVDPDQAEPLADAGEVHTPGPRRGPQWRSIESRQITSSADEAMVTRARQAAEELDRLVRLLPATFVMMRDNMAGQPQAASLEHDGQRKPWCWIHEQTTDRCDQDGWLCTGEIHTGPSDPVGNAAVVVDRAARHKYEVTSRLELVVRVTRDLAAIMAGYPASPLEDDEEAAAPGEELCRACWKDDRYAQFIELLPNGAPYYRGLCRWCGQKRKLIGGDRFPDHDPKGDPPTWMVQMHHAGQRVNSGHIDRARKVTDQLVKAAKPKKTKGRRR